MAAGGAEPGLAKEGAAEAFVLPRDGGSSSSAMVMMSVVCRIELAVATQEVKVEIL